MRVGGNLPRNLTASSSSNSNWNSSESKKHRASEHEDSDQEVEKTEEVRPEGPPEAEYLANLVSPPQLPNGRTSATATAGATAPEPLDS